MIWNSLLAPAARSPEADAPRFRLAFDAVLLRVSLIVICGKEYHVWRFVEKHMPNHSFGQKLMGFLTLAPRWVFLSFLIAGVVTVLLDVAFRMVIRPMMMRWYSPRSRDQNFVPALTFALRPNERMLAELPARRMDGRRRVPGTLVFTNQRLAFNPFAWDGEPWLVGLENVDEIRLEPTVRRVLGLVTGYPDHVSIIVDGREDTAVIVANPEIVLGWFDGQEAGEAAAVAV
jgi:hypothetical protein